MGGPEAYVPVFIQPWTVFLQTVVTRRRLLQVTLTVNCSLFFFFLTHIHVKVLSTHSTWIWIARTSWQRFQWQSHLRPLPQVWWERSANIVNVTQIANASVRCHRLSASIATEISGLAHYQTVHGRCCVVLSSFLPIWSFSFLRRIKRRRTCEGAGRCDGSTC